MKVLVVGTGFVGLTIACCAAENGHTAVGLDIDSDKISRLSRGKLPFHEPDLDSLLERGLSSGRLSFTTSLSEALSAVDIAFIAVGTPSNPDGSPNLSAVFETIDMIGNTAQHPFKLAIKSTVPPGTAYQCEKRLSEILKARNLDFSIPCISNPEFLSEGSAVKNFQSPDRVVLGARNKRDLEPFFEFYSHVPREKILTMDPESAEFVKYASNAMLAIRVSFINEISRMCEVFGGDVRMVSRGVGADRRIGPLFLRAGVGFGGSCLPKDLRAMLHLARSKNILIPLLDSAYRSNLIQRELFIRKISEALRSVSSPTVAVWGLSFKPHTDDVRESPSSDIISALLKAGFQIKAFDPLASEQFRKSFPSSERISFAASIPESVENTDAVVILTDWPHFQRIDWSSLKTLVKNKIIVDGRNLYEPEELQKLGWTYIPVGIGTNRG